MGDEKVIALLLMQQIAVLFLIMGLGFLIEAWNRKDRGQQGTFHGDDLSGFALRDDPCFSD